MNKVDIENFFTKFQKEILELKSIISDERMQANNSELSLLMELFETIDALENLIENLLQKEQSKTIKRITKNVDSIKKKIYRILSNREIDKILFPDNMAIFGLCKVVDTESSDELPEKTITKIVKNGFQRGDKILRPAEIITIKK